MALAKGRYTWRHNKVLESLAETIREAAEDSTQTKSSTRKFVSERTHAKSAVPCNTLAPGILGRAFDWKIAADLKGQDDYPDVVKKSGARPDIVLTSNDAQKCILVELTVPYETNIEDQHEYKLAKYQSLLHTLKSEGLDASIFAVEVGARGFVAASMYSFLKKLDLGGRKISRSIKDLATIAENASCWIWCKRNEA